MIKCITTPLFYASGDPHIGHAFSADGLSRFHQRRGCRTILVTGTDNNGQKIERSAGLSGFAAAPTTDLLIKEFVDRNTLSFRELWRDLSIDFNRFIRTIDKDHHVLVTSIWGQLTANDDIYLGTYDGLYCIDCEQLYNEWQLSSGCCPTHRRAGENVSEPSYLFRLSKFATIYGLTASLSPTLSGRKNVSYQMSP